MRLWSLHPSYLDSAGLVAVWREALLAQAVLLGKTKGYRSHPQLQRFRKMRSPINAIGSYLYFIAEEARARSYRFDRSKITRFSKSKARMDVSSDQMKYEFTHLLKKLHIRDKVKFGQLKNLKRLKPHPIFKMRRGKIADWERISSSS